MEYIIRRWYLFSVYIAGIFALILGLGNWNQQQTALLLGMIFINLHFFEEFGLPGGFAWGGIKVEKRMVDPDVSNWQLNQLSSMWGNNWFAIAVYLLPMFFPQWHWAVLASLIFAYIELLGHLFVFNIGLKSWYNPGLFTAICLTIISTWYFMSVNPIQIFSALDLGIAFIWIVFNYWMAFLGPIFKKFNNNKKYTFSKEDILKSKPYMDKFNTSINDFKNYHE